MKDPLLWQHRFARETTCWLLGHKWVTSWGQKPDFDRLSELPDSEIPYADRKSGNYLYHYRAWWQHKCTRCRTKIRADRYDPWHRKLWWALSNAGGALRIHIEIAWEYGQPTPRRVLCLALAGVFDAYVQFLLYWESVPWSWWTPASNVVHKLYEIADK